MQKPTHASVTKEPCSCDYLQNSVDEPQNPIVFDEPTAEYQFVCQESGPESRWAWTIYHCPFSGGAAPKSKRSLLFATITNAEEERLAQLLAPITTMGDAIDLLGVPDYDGHMTARNPERQDESPSIQHHRHISYQGLSDLADVLITERPDGRVYWQLQGKHLGS